MDIQFYLNRPRDFEYNEEEFPIVLSDYKRLLDIFIYLMNTMAQKKIKDEGWRFFSETLVIKYILSANSLSQILDGSRIESSLSNVSVNMIDISSIFILMRAQIENYLLFFYLYLQPKTKDEQRYRFLIYELAGLNSRQKFDVAMPALEKKKQEENARIQDILHLLRNNHFFQSLESSQQKKILKDRVAKLVGWNSLFEQSDLNPDLYRKIWLLSTNYVHSEYISLMQVKDYLQNSGELISTRNLILTISIMLTCVFIVDFLRHYPEIEERFAMVAENDIRVIQFFNNLGRAKT